MYFIEGLESIYIFNFIFPYTQPVNLITYYCIDREENNAR